MDETRGTPEAIDKADAAMRAFNDAATMLGKWIDGSIRFRPYTTLAAVLGLALGAVWRR
jgi:hypothetical protein